MCLTSTSTPYVLSCGHTICLNDLTQLKIPVERRPRNRRRFAKPLAELASKCAPLLILAFAATDPGAPAQWLYTAAGMLSGRFDSICANPCYSHTEADKHVCQHDCDCDGSRTCSFFAFCVGDSGECTTVVSTPQKAWQLQASVPDSSDSNSERWSHRINSSAFNASWSSNFTLHGVRGLSLQVVVLQGTSTTPTTSTATTTFLNVRVRGPAGYYGRVEVHCDGHIYQQPHATPLAGMGDDDWPLNSDGAVRFEAPSELWACATGTSVIPEGATRDGCNRFSLDVAFSELRYVPTFSMSGGVELASFRTGSEDLSLDNGQHEMDGRIGLVPKNWLPSRWLLEPGSFFVAPNVLWSSMVRRDSSVTAPFDIAGTGRFALRVYPAGSHDAPPGRCSALLTGPHGVKLTFVLRVRDKLFGTLSSPLSCADAGAGCWLKDAGHAATHSDCTGIVAVSFVTVEHQIPVDTVEETAGRLVESSPGRVGKAGRKAKV